jgi:hypothetical protein
MQADGPRLADGSVLEAVRHDFSEKAPNNQSFQFVDNRGIHSTTCRAAEDDIR